MRTIKFRGKRVDNGEWVYGSLIIQNNKEYKISVCYISKYGGLFGWIEVIPETVGQFTGLQDKNGKDIYDGDLVEVPTSYNMAGYYNGKVVVKNGCWVLDGLGSLFDRLSVCEIISNIHEG